MRLPVFGIIILQCICLALVFFKLQEVRSENDGRGRRRGKQSLMVSETLDAPGPRRTENVDRKKGYTRKPVPLPTNWPTRRPVPAPSWSPTTTEAPTNGPTYTPTTNPTLTPTQRPTKFPTRKPTKHPTLMPTKKLTNRPTGFPTSLPTPIPTQKPTRSPTLIPTGIPTRLPTAAPTRLPTDTPTESPTRPPTTVPTNAPTRDPTPVPTDLPTKLPTPIPTFTPTRIPTTEPTMLPTRPPTSIPTNAPTRAPTYTPTKAPTNNPTENPTRPPTAAPTATPTMTPTMLPTRLPTNTPTKPPTPIPTNAPTRLPTETPTKLPTTLPTGTPTRLPTLNPTETPTRAPTSEPTLRPTTISPTRRTTAPTRSPTEAPVTRQFPSVMILLADDMDYGDIGYLGSFTLTPNLDRLANSESSLRLDNFHSGSSICSPSRASLLSGENPERSCVTGALMEDNDPRYTPRADMPSMVRYAKASGYKTGFFGKWHLSRPPIELGYDSWVYSVLNVPTFDPNCFCPERYCIANCTSSPLPSMQCYRSRTAARCSSRLTSNCDLGSDYSPLDAVSDVAWECRYQEGNLFYNVEKAFPSSVAMGDFLGERVVDAIDALNPRDHFFFQLSFYEPHQPLIAGRAARDACFNGITCRSEIAGYGRMSTMTNFYGALAAVDRNVGIVYEKLEQLGRAEDTIFIFTSDNGGENPKVGGVPSASPTRFLKGFKRSVFEGGTRVPAFIHWPDRIFSNYIVNEPTSMLDIFPTITEIILGINPKAGQTEPIPSGNGMSWISMINDPISYSRTQPFGVCAPLTKINSEFCSTFAYIEGRIKVVINNLDFAHGEAYNIVVDPRERTNIMKFVSGTGILLRAKTWRQGIAKDYYGRCRNHPQ